MSAVNLLQSTPVRITLPNGLLVLVQPLPHLASVSLGVNVAVGSRDEREPERGLSHLVEHMVFQGTRRRDTRELSRVLAAVGGHLDAATGRESTTFYAKVPAPHFSLALDVIADMLRHPQLPERELRKEKRVILEEIRMVEDAPDEYVHDLLFQSLWPRHPLGWPILGTRRHLRAAHRADLAGFMARHYQPGKMILAVAGRITPAAAAAEARRLLGRLAKTPGPAAPAPALPKSGARALVQRRSLEQVHVCLGVRGLAYASPQRLASLAVNSILGGGPNSRLFYEIRERRALVYAVYSFVDYYRDTGLAGIYLACHPRNLSEALKRVQEETHRLASAGPTAQEGRDIREQMRGNLLISLESSSTHMWNLLQQEMYLQSHPTPAQVLREIDGLSRAGLAAAMRSLFLKAPVCSAAVGPISEAAEAQLRGFRI
ncbi:MAG: pitrilysin family protein [candidate division FCPU426 bacterium]